LHVDRWHSERRIDRIVVFYCEHISRAAYRPRRLELLPIDRRWLEQLQQEKWPTQILPTFTMDADRLFSALVRQYLFVSLFRACAESLASENASRLAAMRGAERNIGERIDELTSQFHQTRQMAITEELLDIVAGFEALGTEP
jgi:F-type H+-transporting ATPase subunit gamma